MSTQARGVSKTTPQTRRALESMRADDERRRRAIQSVSTLSTVPTNEEIARAFNALKAALEQ